MRAPSKLQLLWRACAATLLLCAAGVLPAQAAADTAGDPPDRVARLSYMEGDVGLLPSGAQDWGEAGINRPLTTGDRLSSSTGARAELELDGAALRLDGGTDVGFLQLDDQLAQLELTQGTLSLTVRQLDEGQSYEIDTPTVALVVDHPGSFRVDVGADGQATRITAFDGNATVYGQNDAQRLVVAGRSYRFADSALADVAVEDLAGGDDFDAWSDERDRRYADSDSRRYVSDDVIGYQDLDRYGDWSSDPEYGQVWYPAHVDTGWAPYRDGHWAWVGPWGWTWVDDAPWGFAPYHYGRWAWRSRGWCWVPGPIGWRPVYAPALVAFVGGGHWRASVGSGAPIGWYPLGPGDVYDPWYRGSRRYYTRINVTNIHMRDRAVSERVDRRYRDWHRGIAPPVRALHGKGPRGFTAVPARNFANADRVQRHRLNIDPDKLGGARLLGRAATPKPTPHSFAPPRPPRAGALPAQGFRRAVVARHAPSAELVADRATHARPLAAPAHVRVLRPHADTLPAVARIVPARGLGQAREAPRVPIQAGGRDVRTAGVPARMAPREMPLRPGELRSARFVRAHEAGEPAQPRPGVSFISTARTDRDRAAPTLPQVPHFERADASRTPVRRPDAEAGPRFQRAPDFDARARAARIEDARREPMPRPSPVRGMDRPTQPAHLRAPDFDAQLHARAAAPPPRFQRSPDFRQMRPMPHAAPMQRSAPPPRQAQPAQSQAPAPHPRHEPAHRFDPQH
ncbi:DUF6600 domain-containing protein [Frateuria terrea]|uniref:FecR family protein n=1 Tax=Frateuria terrea TaxID=529704 RepID=A0A1H6YWD3_9GAMM|nr:DUF6600 domain-containing protein [Frateuria terrea]SEJ45569.1 FecR family protein [Frateuria terrea]SFP76917.1 FecR family protein [Frateuria terrea]